MLSEAARRFLTELQQLPEASLCPDCASTRLSLEKWDVMKLVRELIADGSVLARYKRCEVCLNETLVVTTRSHPSSA